MNIEIRVHPNSKKEYLKFENGIYTLHVRALAIDNKANNAVIDFFKTSLKIKKSSIIILKGEKSRIKLLSIDVDENRWSRYISEL